MYSTSLYATIFSNIFLQTIVRTSLANGHHAASTAAANHSEIRFPILQTDYRHVAVIYNIILWVFLTVIAKIGFHSCKRVSSKLPESCSMIVLGIILGLALKLLKFAPASTYSFNSNVFFLYLLPPIILDSGYFMPSRAFFDNCGTILLFAIINTLFNTIAIGLTLYAFNFTTFYGEETFELLHCLVFATLISAVDPVAVLATFEDIHVNETLYIIVFGESLLNDAVSVALYKMFSYFAKIGQSNIIARDIIFGIISFFAVSLGGLLIGTIFGAVGSFITKFMEVVPVLEPLMVIMAAYLSYLTAEMFGVSGIIAITAAGMILRQYIRYNLSEKSCITTEYVLKMMSTLTESIIFLFMGLSVFNSSHSWNTGFVIITIVSCLMYRVIGVVVLASLANIYRLVRLSYIDMVVMSYGGLRGAIAFALALILNVNFIPAKPIFVTTTVIVIYFTVFIQGTTIGPIVKLLKVRTQQAEEPSLSAKLTSRMIDHVMAMIGNIAETTIGFNARLLDKIRKFDLTYLKPIFLRTKFDEEQDIVFLTTMEKINFQKHDEHLPVTTVKGLDIREEDSSGLIPDRKASNLFNIRKYESDLKTRKVHKMLDHFLLTPQPNSTMQRRLEDERYSLSVPQHVTGSIAAPSQRFANRLLTYHPILQIPEAADATISLTSGAGYRYHQYQPYYRRTSRPYPKREIDEMPTIQRTEAERYKPWKKRSSTNEELQCWKSEDGTQESIGLHALSKIRSRTQSAPDEKAPIVRERKVSDEKDEKYTDF